MQEAPFLRTPRNKWRNLPGLDDRSRLHKIHVSKYAVLQMASRGHEW